MKLSIQPKPEGVQWTDDQWKAISAKGSDILVAAAAGSGKTAVLVERIIRKVMDKDTPIDVDRLLIVTFTNAAAAEMRHRIGEALEKAISENPTSLHLRKQLSLLNRASISTLHSFCLEVIRKYYFLIDIDPSFRIAETTESELLREEVMEELFEEEYGKEGNEAFFELVDRYTGDRNDSDLQLMVKKLYDESQAHPNPDVWLDKLVEGYRLNPDTSIDELPFISSLFKEIALQLDGMRSILTQALEITNRPLGPAPRAANIQEDLQQITELEMLLHKGWSSMYERMQNLHFSTLKTCKGDVYDQELVDSVKDLREKAKKQIKLLQETYFQRRPDSYLQDLVKMEGSVSTLITLVKEFKVRYQQVKREKGLVDFGDLEHYTLQILRTTNEDGVQVLSEAALYYKRHFHEVLLDEYQDTNFVQESIVQAVCKSGEDGGNLFMVGDVKQSIYRFRLAEAGLFLSKYKRFSPEGNEFGLRIDLSQNFRSRSEVLNGTNYIFKQVMDEQVGEINYDEQAELKIGAFYPESMETKAELLIINSDGEDTESDVEDSENDSPQFDAAELETVQLEARLMAQKIKELIQKPFQIYDRKLDANRNITYRDIVILLRSMPWAPQIMEEFKEQGIPVYAELSSGYFEATEVSIMMSLLKVIDNPYQDIPLAAVLRSPIVGLKAEELAFIRMKQKKGNYYEAVKAVLEQGIEEGRYAKTFEKLMDFHLMLQKWRAYARQGSLSELIWRIYQKTGYYDFVGGMPGGKQRQANLRALYDRARQYESTSFRGLFRFLRFIERMQDRGDDLGTARALGEQEDVVRMMTIHKSKGLEFPVVFVAGLSKPFNVRDLSNTFLLHKDLGFGSKYIDPVLRISYPTLPLLAIKQQMKNELLAEEMRVLYVALTRAKEKLYLVGTVKKLEKKLNSWREQLWNKEWLLPNFERSKAKCYMDWVAPSVIRHDDAAVLRDGEDATEVPRAILAHPSKWSVSIVDPSQLEQVDAAKLEMEVEILEKIKKGEQVPLESTFKLAVQDRLLWEYGYKTATEHRSKQSVSEIKRMREEHVYSDTTLVNVTRKSIADRPRFMQEQQLTAAEIGTAMHMVMQHISLDQPVTKEIVKEKIARMVLNELLTKEQESYINIAGIVQFFETELGKRILNSPNVMRELPFSVGLQADEVYPNWVGENETILLQGVIDLLFEDEQGIVLVDFKTDKVTGKVQGSEQTINKALKNRYAVQLELYSKAVEHIYKKTLNEKYLYFFDGSHLVII
ncbi:helicase-exonuclease AddAB subunit AddA [Bacillus suaedaesalsae]|uniref:ATP-dependent helicase/nuclease subunit A n=1 Tax=Bacillus suaedaesalsae TaxID=2810349 RepID=A0ABS2DF90_9BACI|nr:helicase-exonuclease AddAB subunit AddA [Bacillus suaedaesalsae]MBM6617139.1 helicase-exonuclease AddAB subunit AddA [Bacillus suaedaesalsae]